MSNYTLLLIDYEPRSIERMRRPLEQAGIRVEVATDGAAGLEAFDRLQPDAVIVEAMLPKRHGFEVCQEIKKSANGKRTPVIVTTGVYKGRRYRTQAMHIHGADEYLEKPLTDEQIVQTVKRFLAERPERPASAPAPAPPPTPVATAPRPAPPAPTPLDLSGDDSDLFEIIDESLSLPTASAAPKAPPAPTPPTPPTPVRSTSVVGDMTEDEISARLDALLPSDPAVSTEVSWESGRAVGHLESQPEPQGRTVAVADEPVVEPIRDVAAEILADFPPMPEVGALPDDIGMDPSNLDIAPPQAEAQVFDFDAGRQARKKGRGATEAPAAPKPLAERSHGTSAVAPVVELARAPVVAEAPLVTPPLTESYETPKRGLPIWVWGLAVAGLAAGAYFAFLRTPPPAADPAPAATTAPEIPPPPAAPETQAETPGPVAAAPEPQVKRAAPIAAAPVDPAPLATIPPASRPQDPPPASSILAWTPAKPAARPVTSPAPPDTVPPTPSAPVNETFDDPSLAVAPVAPAVAVPAATKPATRAGDLVSINDVDSPPIGLEKPSPQYTTLGRTRRQEGNVVFEVLVDETGRVADIRLIRGIAGSDLNDAAMNAARSWVYKPAVKDGVPVRVWRPEQVRFKL
jgi:TonB family protein